MLEYADSFRENLRYLSRIVNAHYETPLAPGYSTGYTDEALVKYVYLEGSFWQSDVGQKIANQPTDGEL